MTTGFVTVTGADRALIFDDLDLVSCTGRAATVADVTASTNPSAYIHTVNYKKPALTRVQRPMLAMCFLWLVTLFLWPFDPKINGFPGRTHCGTFLCQVGDPSCIGFWDILWKNRQTHRQMEVKTLSPRLPSMWLTTITMALWLWICIDMSHRHTNTRLAVNKAQNSTWKKH